MTEKERERRDLGGAPDAGQTPGESGEDAHHASDMGRLIEPDGALTPAKGPLPGPVTDPPAESTPGFLELVYGALFAPADTFRRIAPAPPMRLTLIIVTLVNAAGALMNVFVYRAIAPRGSEWELMLAALMPFIALVGFFWWYLKWLGYGSVLHLVTQMLGGVNGPKATLTVYGLAELPVLFLLPVEALVISAGLGEAASARLVGPARLGVFVWSLVLLTIGLREAHGLTTKRAVTVVLLPAAAAVLFLILVLIILGLGFSTSFAPFFVPF